MLAQVTLRLTAAQLLGNVFETLFYGIYIVTLCFCIQTLFLTGSGIEERWLGLQEIHWVMAFATLAFFVICTFNVAIGVLFNSYIFNQDFAPSKLVFLKPNNIDWVNTVRSLDQIIVVIIGDFVLLYRCWIVYGRRWRVILPSLTLYLGSLFIAARLVAFGKDLSTLTWVPTHQDYQISPERLSWWIAFFGVTAVQNVFTTGILIWRIWHVERQTEKYLDRSETHRPRHLHKVIRVIAESGAVYTTMMLSCTLLYALEGNALYLSSSMALQTAGITFNVIIYRSSARRDRQFSEFDRNERTTLGSIRFTHGRTTIMHDTESVIHCNDISATKLEKTGNNGKFSAASDLAVVTTKGGSKIMNPGIHMMDLESAT